MRPGTRSQATWGWTCGAFLSAVVVGPDRGGAEAASPAAVDLLAVEVEVTQAIQHGSTPLVAGNVTLVRARIEVSDRFDVPGVDGVLRVFVGGVETALSPLRSLNGPIIAHANPDEAAIDDWLNFLFLPPQAADVTLRLELNPLQSVAELSYDNNLTLIENLEFQCRGTVDLAYVPINYTFNGAGLPAPALIEPGIGDGFVRAIYRAGEWNTFESPLPTFTWAQDVNATAVELLLALQDIRVNMLPGSGFPQPDFIYGWLPGNPYVGGGRAIGIPGDTAFGNTQTVRHQRTFAHELGHLLGLSHNTAQILQVGVDGEHHLADTEGLAQTFAPSLWDVMVAGQVTAAAFVAENTYLTALADDRLQCGGAAGRGTGPLLRVRGSFDRTQRTLALDPVLWVERGDATRSRPGGDIDVQLLDDAGDVISELRLRSDEGAVLCPLHPGEAEAADVVPIHALVPAAEGGVAVAGIRALEASSRRVLSQRSRTADGPQVAFDFVGPAGSDTNRLTQGEDERRVPLAGLVRVLWRGDDAQGDELVCNLLYSFDSGGAWLPLALGLRARAFEFDTASVPASRGASGRLRLVVSDGLNNTVIDTPHMALGLSAAPAVHLFTPNHGSAHRLGAPVAFHGSAWDREDFMLADDRVTWSSDRDGPIGQGRLFVADSLSVGPHVITMEAVDASGQPASDQVSIEITPRDVFDADVNDDGSVSVQDLVAVIASWGACPRGGPDACPADVSGDGSVGVQDLIEVVGAWEP